MLINKQTNKQCFQKNIRCISNANDAGNASVACAVNTDDAACDVNADGAANVTATTTATTTTIHQSNFLD